MNAPLNMLISFHYWRDVNLDEVFNPWRERLQLSLFADSGAFSAHAQGKPIDWRAYAEWLQRWKGHFDIYANLDVIGSLEGTQANQAALEGEGLAPLPVFHCGEPFDVLEGLLGRYPYICLGGMAPHLKRRDVIAPWLVKCFEMAKGTGAVYHGFGCGTWDLMRAFPWRSSDSTSGSGSYRYGGLLMFDPTRRQFFSAKMGKAEAIMRHADLIRYYGLEPRQFYDRAQSHRRHSFTLGQLSYYEAGLACTAMQTGPYQFYSALVSVEEVSWMLEDVSRHTGADNVAS